MIDRFHIFLKDSIFELKIKIKIKQRLFQLFLSDEYQEFLFQI